MKVKVDSDTLELNNLDDDILNNFDNQQLVYIHLKENNDNLCCDLNCDYCRRLAKYYNPVVDHFTEQRYEK